MTLIQLLNYIDQNINTQAGGDKITGAEHNSVLKEVVNSLVEITGTGYGGGIAPNDNPGVQTKPIFFMAEDKGKYTYCGGVQVSTNLAFISWDGTTWSVKDVGVPDIALENSSKCYGLAKATDPAPAGRSVGDWFVFLGGGQLVWPGGVKDAPGIVYADRMQNIAGTNLLMWELIPFGGDRHMKGIATPALNIGSLCFLKDDYYLVIEAGDYSQFSPITANAVQSAGVIKYDGSKWVYTKNSGSSEGGGAAFPEWALNAPVAWDGSGLAPDLATSNVDEIKVNDGTRTATFDNPINVSTTKGRKKYIVIDNSSNLSVIESITFGTAYNFPFGVRPNSIATGEKILFELFNNNGVIRCDWDRDE